MLISSLTKIGNKFTQIVSIWVIIGHIFLAPFIPQLSAASPYSESTNDTFAYYKQKLESALQDVEREFTTNNNVTDNTINTIRNLLQEAYIRLPDRGEQANTNESIKKSVDMYLDKAARNKSSEIHVRNAVAQAARFISEAKIDQITGGITANPTSGNAPLTSSFLANARDPSGVNIPDINYIWWTRERGGLRREIGRGPTLTYTFPKEGNYQVFLDVLSDSRNTTGKPDVLPLTVSQDISVKPRLGNIVLLINGVNVSNLDQFKVSPSVGKIGLLFDATASRAVSNGSITKTEWDFGNGNAIQYESSPIVERQLFVNEGTYKIVLSITTNQGQTFQKQLTIIVRDPAAVISTEQDSAFVGDEVRMNAKTYLSNISNVEYNWQVQDDSGKKVTSMNGATFKYKFPKVGQYLVTLTTKNPNGNTDTDSRPIIIESHPPTVNLDTPIAPNREKPNTILFDASRSFDLDSKSSRGLIYSWTIDGQKVELENISHEGASGVYTFSSKGQHSVSLTVSNQYGKVSTVDRLFDVSSLLTVGVNITPRVAPIGTPVTFQARSPRGSFFEWNFGDGSPAINGTSDSVQHIYKSTGVYSISLKVKSTDGTEENSIIRSVYVTDTSNPFALIDVTNSTNTIIENPTGCSEMGVGGSFLINRADGTTIDGGKSINVDGTTSGLSYTWRYMGRIKTGPTLSERFTELGCFPIELTVRSEKTGATHTSKKFLEIKNLEPKLTSISTAIDETKKDSQKIIVNVIANGARDDDGVITSYIWYYTTESDSEKQNVKITQSPTTTFILPNVTEKYYFGVIIEDNDGARMNSDESLANQPPLLIANDEANINMPLINLSVDKTQVLTDEVINFSASVKDILGRNITSKSEYYWDFDGDGQVDKKTTQPQISYTYKNSGRYNMRLKVINNGSSNTKYQVMYVKNELKAGVKGFHIGNMVYFLNTSRGTFEKTSWNLGGTSSESQNSSMTSWPLTGQNSITIKSGSNEISTAEITSSSIEDVPVSTGGQMLIQTYPNASGGTISVDSTGDKILISAFGNTAKEYIIDTDTKVDSDLDGIGDNDKDNANTPSYSDGSAFLFPNIENIKTRNREMKITLINPDGTILGSQKINLLFSYIPGNDSQTTVDINGTGGLIDSFSTIDKKNLEQLQAKIRGMNPDDRIIFTKLYNQLVENWDDLHDRTQGLLDIQTEVNDNQALDTKTKEELSELIDIILVGDAQATNEISVASRVIEGLIKVNNPDRDYILERLEQIKTHPANLTENKKLGKEILQKIEIDSSLSNGDKLLIKSQLQIIVNGGQESISDSDKQSLEAESTQLSSSSGGILGFIQGTVKIFGLIVVIIILLIIIGYIVYRISRKKDGEMGFQDFLIDSIAHTKAGNAEGKRKEATSTAKAIEVKPTENTIITPSPLPAPSINPISSSTNTNSVEPIEAHNVPTINIDPLATFTPGNIGNGVETTITSDPLSFTTAANPQSTMNPTGGGTEGLNIPDWLKPTGNGNTTKTSQDSLIPTPSEVIGVDNPILSGEKPTTNIGQEISDKKGDTSSNDVILHPESASILTNKDLIEEGIVINTDENKILAPTGVDMLPIEDHLEKDVITMPNNVGDAIDEGETNNIEHINLPDTHDVIEDPVPDWLKPDSLGGDIENNTSTQNNDGFEKGITSTTIPSSSISPSPAPTDLPDWLKASVNESQENVTAQQSGAIIASGTEELNNDANNPPKKNQRRRRPSGNKEKTRIQNNEINSGMPPNTTLGGDIPDWLK